MQVTCATVLISHDKKHLLMGKIALTKLYELPKGKKVYKEKEIEAAKRELKEETGLDIDIQKYLDLEHFANHLPYSKSKRISVFFVYDRLNQYLYDPDLKHLACQTFFSLSKNRAKSVKNGVVGQLYPEFDGFMLMDIKSLIHNKNYRKQYLSYNMQKLFCNPVFVQSLRNVLNDEKV